MRSVAGHQDSAFDGAAAGDADIACREIAQPAVHQLGTPPAGAEGQVVLLHQRDAQTAGRCVQSNARAGYAAADHDYVERLAVGQGGQLGGAAGFVECCRAGQGFRYPFSECASSTARASASRMGSTIWAD